MACAARFTHPDHRSRFLDRDAHSADGANYLYWASGNSPESETSLIGSTDARKQCSSSASRGAMLTPIHNSVELPAVANLTVQQLPKVSCVYKKKRTNKSCSRAALHLATPTPCCSRIARTPPGDIASSLYPLPPWARRACSARRPGPPCPPAPARLRHRTRGPCLNGASSPAP